MAPDKFQKRLSKLFDDVERIASQPELDAETMRRELNALQARLAALEKQYAQSQGPNTGEVPLAQASSLPTQGATPILYEKEQMGYSFSGQVLEPLRMSDLSIQDTDEVIEAPLVAAGRPIGAMMVEPQPERPLSSEDASLVEKIAQQASLQIQNLRLLAAAERARAEAQAATRRFAHESWQSFLDAINQREQIGFAYDQQGVEPYMEKAPSGAAFQETVSVLDQQIGRIILESDPTRPLTDQDKAMVSAVARQLSQQVENLRLLADAARARAQAEEATRSLARDSWKEYVERSEETLAFVYDSVQVTPLAETPENISYAQPLTVHGEPIGQLAVADRRNISSSEASLIESIARQTSIHLETLRLNEQLQKRAQELQELDRLKSSFLANMSHELRTPLNSILGFSDVMLEGIDGPLTDFMENDLKLIQKNGQHLLHLINDVLDMAKIESGRMNLHPEKFKVHEVFDEVASITSTLASEKNLALFVESDSDGEIEIFADVTRIRQVIINLVNNSIKFTEKGKISMRVDRLDEENVKITVRDTGIGVPADHLETIFQEFSQVDTSTTRKVGGTGLGLPISRKLVEMHGGRMWAESTGVNGEGTQMYVILPIEARLAEGIEKTTKK
jgi:signal transduction histidine kinase